MYIIIIIILRETFFLKIIFYNNENIQNKQLLFINYH